MAGTELEECQTILGYKVRLGSRHQRDSSMPSLSWSSLQILILELRGLALPVAGPAARGVGEPPLTRRPRGFSTFGLREKCMCRLPSSLMVTDTFFRVLFPQCEQNTRLMSDVVLERKGKFWQRSHGGQTPSPEHKMSHGCQRRRRKQQGTGETEWPNMSQTMAAQPCVAETSRHCAVPRAKMNKVTQAASP